MQNLVIAIEFIFFNNSIGGLALHVSKMPGVLSLDLGTFCFVLWS